MTFDLLVKGHIGNFSPQKKVLHGTLMYKLAFCVMCDKWKCMCWKNEVFQWTIPAMSFSLYILQALCDVECIRILDVSSHTCTAVDSRNYIIQCHLYTTHVKVVWCQFLETCTCVMTSLSLNTLQYMCSILCDCLPAFLIK